MKVYSKDGIEHALHRYGVLGELRRMGYGPFRVEIKDEGVGQSARALARSRPCRSQCPI